MAETILKCKNLHKKIGKKEILKGVSLEVNEGEILGFIGPNGAGKTTLISMITGMFEPNYGNAWIGGYDIKSSIEKAQLQMGVCPQFDLLWPQLTVAEHLYFYGRLKGVPTKIMDKKVT